MRGEQSNSRKSRKSGGMAAWKVVLTEESKGTTSAAAHRCSRRWTEN